MCKKGGVGLHYLDNSATTAVSAAAARKALEIMTENFGNPSSLHTLGINAEHELEAARDFVARAISADSGEIIFTSGGTEANNLALFGAAEAKRRTCRRVIISSTEHSSVIEAAKKLSDDGYEVVRISPSENGVIEPSDVASAVTPDTSLVSVMLVNNETGAINPVAEIFEAVRLRNKNVICHTDAVQAFGKLDFKVKKLGADLLTVSAHKVHAPKGCGALYIKKGVRILPRQIGGEQEKRIRSGTEPLPAIAAFGVACTEFDIAKNLALVSELNNYAREKLTKFARKRTALRAQHLGRQSPQRNNAPLPRGEGGLCFLGQRVREGQAKPRTQRDGLLKTACRQRAAHQLLKAQHKGRRRRFS